MKSVVDELLEDYKEEILEDTQKDDIEVEVYYSAKFNDELRKYDKKGKGIVIKFDHIPTDQEIIDAFVNNDDILRLKNWSFDKLSQKVQNDPRFWNNNSGWKDFKILGYYVSINIKLEKAIQLPF